jgi:cation transport regulator
MELQLIENKLLERAKEEGLELSVERIDRLKQKAIDISNIMKIREAKNYKGDTEPYERTDTEFLEALEEFAKVYEEAPYKTNKDLPPAIQKYPGGAQKAFREAFNNALEHYKNETTAFKVAWAVLKRYLKDYK